MVGLEYPRARSRRSASIPYINTSSLGSTTTGNTGNSAASRRNSSVQDVASWRNQYCIHKELGRGHFAKVYHVVHCVSKEHFAAKVVRRKSRGMDRVEYVREEIRILKKIWEEGRCRGVVNVVEVFESLMDIGIIMEIANGGSLYTVTASHSDNGLPEKYVQIIIKKLIKVLQIIHSFNIVHLDLKADNILLRKPYPSTDIALSDFGLAVQLTNQKNHRELAGTPDYSAPEIINYDNISVNTDMWSLGVLTYFLLTSKSPFMGDTKEDTMMNVSKLNYFFPENVFDFHKSAPKDFISKLIIKKPSHRMSSKEATEHHWIQPVQLDDDNHETILTDQLKSTDIKTSNKSSQEDSELSELENMQWNPNTKAESNPFKSSSSSSSSSSSLFSSSSFSPEIRKSNINPSIVNRRNHRTISKLPEEHVTELENLRFTNDSGFSSSD